MGKGVILPKTWNSKTAYVAGARTWNDLPSDVTSSVSFEFCSHFSRETENAFIWRQIISLFLYYICSVGLVAAVLGHVKI